MGLFLATSFGLSAACWLAVGGKHISWLLGSSVRNRLCLPDRPAYHHFEDTVGKKNANFITAMKIWTTIAAALAAALAYFTARFLNSRRELRMLQRAELVNNPRREWVRSVRRIFANKVLCIQPMPDVHPIFGHLPFVKRMAAALPADTIMHNVVWRIARDLFPGGAYYLHLWPFSQTLLIVADAHMATQVEGLNLGKGDNLVKPIETITGGPSLLTMEGQTWKRWRRLFSTGFSAGYLVSLAPIIADEVATFRDLLIKKCEETPGGRSEVFQMEEMTVRMTFDVIGRVVLDTRLNYQTRENPLAAALRSSIEWTSWRGQLNPVTKYLTIRPIVHWLNSRTMNQYIGHEIDKRFAERLKVGTEEKSGDQDFKDTSKQSKAIVSLLVDDLLLEAGGEDVNHVKEIVKPAMASQLRAFLFAGHDTSSSALTYSYYLLSKHPESLNRLVAEHDAVFGAEPADALAQIHADPYKLNQLPYTTALLKETLRLFPPSGSMRVGRRGAFLVDETGRRFPTENCSVWTLSLAIHHDARYWVEPESFLPERWLASPDDLLYPGGTKTSGAAWRPFEHGPRTCIGQSLALLELKIALVLTAREINVVPAYEEWDALHQKKDAGRVKTVDGNRVYQAEKGAAHPADGFPVRVELRRR